MINKIGSHCMKYRVFTNVLGWSDVIYLFDIDIKFSDIKNNPRTKYLDKQNLVGVYEFDNNFLNLFNKSEINGKSYYFKFTYTNDDKPQEERQWRSIPEFTEKEIKKYKNVDANGFSDASDSLF